MRITFPSIASSNQIAYQYDSDAYSRSPLVCSQFRLYETMGDGMIAHTPSLDIAPERLTDYLHSALQFMFSEKQSDETTLSERMCREVMRGPCTELIAFAASIVSKESDKEWGKKRYYSTSLMKIGRKPELEYDKRYAEIPYWADGTAESIYRLLSGEWHDGLTAYTYAYNIREWCLNNKVYCEMPGFLMGWMREDREADRDLKNAFFSLRSFAQSRDLLDCAKRGLESYARTLQSVSTV